MLPPTFRVPSPDAGEVLLAANFAVGTEVNHMKAVVMREFGGPDVLRYEDVPTPEPGSDEVLVEIHAVSVNQTLDIAIRAGKRPQGVKFPLVLGIDPSGVVTATGPNVEGTGVKVGDRVTVTYSIRCGSCESCISNKGGCNHPVRLGIDRWGGYAEYVAVPVTNVYPIPDVVSFEDATVVSRHFPMAYHLLVHNADLQAGEWVLVMGAAGALGSMGVQIAKMIGARVIAGAGADERVQVALSYGADYGVNYRKQALRDEVMRITGGVGVDVIYENISDPRTWSEAFGSLGYRGRLVTAGAHGGGMVTLDAQQLYLKRQRIIGVAGAGEMDIPLGLKAAAEGRIKALIDRRLPLWEAPLAHEAVEGNQAIGKIILEPFPGASAGESSEVGVTSS